MTFGVSACGEGGGGSSPPPSTNSSQGTINGQVSGTTVVAVGDDGNILASDDTAGKVPNAQGQFAFSLTGIPVGQNVRIYLMHNGAIFPMFIGTNNVFSLTTIGTVDLGIVVTDVTTGQASPANSPPTMTPHTPPNPAAPPGLFNPPISGLNFSQLLDKGFQALKDGIPPRARVFFNAAVAQSAGRPQSQLDEAHFFAALSTVAAVPLDTPSDGNPSDLNRAGDLLDLLGTGCPKIQRNDPQVLWKACYHKQYPSAPSGPQLQTFLYGNVFRPALLSAVNNLGQVSDNFQSRQWSVSAGNQTLTLTSDKADALFFKAYFEVFLASIAVGQSYDLTGVQSGVTQQLTEEQYLNQNPNLLRLKANGSTTLTEAKGYLSSAIDDLKATINFIENQRKQPVPNTELITLAPAGKTINAYKQLITLDALKNSLSDATTVRAVILNLSEAFGPAGMQDLRSLLPTVTGNVPGFFPDPSFGGVLVSGFNVNKNCNHNFTADILEKHVVCSP